MQSLATQSVIATDFIPATTAAYRLGMLSAQLGEICCPEMVFVTRHDQREFCKGWRDFAGNSITTTQILGEVQQ